ncbi:hypothetical protein GCM10007359_04470 [Rothia aerolata]|uniref:NADPH:quinone reductase n=2 Tax=Rothia aerolata TaxID=1812262 RepID=A0A917IMV3_9MICC|nr:hypothetical protein GCM10007359_04470 [Rothia aerolata]
MIIMRQAIIDSAGNRLVIDEQPTGSGAAKVLAAAINPVDLAIAGGHFPFREYKPGQPLGLSGVAEAADGSRYYFYNPPLPAGSFSDSINLSQTPKVPLPENLDPELAALLGPV